MLSRDWISVFVVMGMQVSVRVDVEQAHFLAGFPVVSGGGRVDDLHAPVIPRISRASVSESRHFLLARERRSNDKWVNLNREH